MTLATFHVSSYNYDTPIFTRCVHFGTKNGDFHFLKFFGQMSTKKSRKSGFFDTLHESVKMNTDFTLKYFESKVTLSHLVVHRVLQVY